MINQKLYPNIYSVDSSRFTCHKPHLTKQLEDISAIILTCGPIFENIIFHFHLLCHKAPILIWIKQYAQGLVLPRAQTEIKLQQKKKANSQTLVLFSFDLSAQKSACNMDIRAFEVLNHYSHPVFYWATSMAENWVTGLFMALSVLLAQIKGGKIKVTLVSSICCSIYLK